MTNELNMNVDVPVFSSEEKNGEKLHYIQCNLSEYRLRKQISVLFEGFTKILWILIS